MNLLKNKYLKIILVLGAAFIVCDFSVKNLFLANSPKFNPYAVQNMTAKANSLWSKTANLIAFKSNNSSTGLIKVLPKATLNALSAPLFQVSQGVYAGERNGIKVYEIRSNEITYVVYTFTVNRKPVTIKVPKGQNPPSQAVLEKLFP